MSEKRGVILADIHVPHQIRLGTVTRFIRDFQPDYLIYLGDQIDAGELWGWQSRSPGQIDWNSIKLEVDTFKSILQSHIAALVRPARVEKHLWFGNHEQRIYDWRRAYAPRAGRLTWFPSLRRDWELDKWGFHVHRQNELARFGKLYLTHGYACDEYHAKKVVTDMEANVAYGHMHTFQTYTKVGRIDTLPKMATALPCLCSVNPEYRRGTPNRWVNGFTVFYLRSDGTFNLYPVVMVDGVFTAPTGKDYR